MLDFQKAMDHGRRAVELYPKNPRSRQNYALYAMYAGDLQDRRGRGADRRSSRARTQYKAYLPLAAVAFASAISRPWRSAYESMRGSGAPARPWRHSDWPIWRCIRDAGQTPEKLLEDGIAADEKSNERLARAAKLTALAEVHLAQNRAPLAVRAVQDAMAITREDATLVSAALVLVRAGRRAEAQSIAEELGRQFQPRRRAYAAIIEGDIARTAGRVVEAKDAFDRAQKAGGPVAGPVSSRRHLRRERAE